MPINNSYNQNEVILAIRKGLEDFYEGLTNKLKNLDLLTILKNKNPYLYRAKGLSTARQIVDSILSAFVSSSEETMFGQVFFEPLAIAASGGHKSLATGIDVQIEKKDENTVYAIAVKSGPKVFNADSKKRQEQNFQAGMKLASQAKERYVPIIGYGYGSKQQTNKGTPKIYQELSGQDFWTEITGDPEFYQDIIQFMGTMPESFVEQFEECYQQAEERLLQDFESSFCDVAGEVDWAKLVGFVSGSKKAS